jgi:hypothetical protein
MMSPSASTERGARKRILGPRRRASGKMPREFAPDATRIARRTRLIEQPQGSWDLRGFRSASMRLIEQPQGS